MAHVEVNVEFGKCALKAQPRGSIIPVKESVKEILLEDVVRTGSLYFNEHRMDGKHLPFILTPYSVNMNDFVEKLFSDWKLPPPRIVLFTVTDTETCPSDEYRKLSRKLVKGIVRALNTTEMWLCTDGLDIGFSKDIGGAFEKELSRRKTLEKGVQKEYSVFPETALIGICDRDILTFTDKFGEKTQVKMSQEILTGEKKDVNRRHEYFIFVEDTTENKNGISRFMLELANHIIKYGQSKSVMDSKSEDKVSNSELPVMLLLLHGKINQINFILGHLKRRLPLVIIEGSGGLADLLAYAYYQATRRPEGINVAEYTESVLKPQVSDKVSELYPDFSDFSISSVTEKVFDCIRNSTEQERQFITLLNLNDIEFEPTKLPHYLLRALFKSQTSSTLKNVRQMKTDLFLAMDWNSADVAMEEVFIRDPTRKFEIDGETFFRALTKPHREDFVSLFLNQGFLIHTYLGSSNLINLFQNSMNREFFRSIVWESVLGYGTNTEITRNFLDSKLIILIEELTGIPSLINSYELDWISRGIYDSRTTAEAERKSTTVLVMWAILSYRVQLVKTIWQHSEQPIHIALVCSQILRKLEKFVTDLNLKNEIRKQSLEFSTMAVGVMTLCYDSVPCRALDVLNEKNNVWSHKALMEIAAFAKNKMFLAHPCCQKYLDRIFMGHIKVRDLSHGDFTIPLWLKMVFCSFFIFPMYLWIRFEPEEEKSPAIESKESSSEVTDSDNKEQLAQTVQKKKVGEPGFFRKIYYIWTAPISKFWSYQVFYVLFLTLFSLAVIWPACGNVYLDFFTCVWMVIYAIDSIYHSYTLSTKYTSMPLAYKCMEIAIMIIFLFAYAMGRLIWPQTFMSPYSAKVMLCIALVYFYYRLIFIALPISSDLGPMLYRVKRMVTVDFTSFIRVAILVIISNGIVIHATIYPDYPLNIELVRRAFYDALISFFLTPSDHYGIPDPKCIRLKRHSNRISFYGTPENECKVGRYYLPACPNPGVWPYIYGLQYLIILRLILVVLLFALFSNTARKLEEQGKYIWKYQRYALITNFSNRLSLPPPLCIITFIYMTIKYIYKQFLYCMTKYVLKYFKVKQQKKYDKFEQDKLDENDFRYWKSLAKEYHNIKKQEKAEEMTTKKRMERIFALTNALDNQRRTLRDLEGHLNELQIEIKNAHKHLELTDLQVSVRERLRARNIPQIFSRISPYPNTMVSRFPVSDNHVPWKIQWTKYDPIAFTLPKEDFPTSLQPHVDVDIQKLREIEGDAFKMPHFNWNKMTVSLVGETLDRQSWITTGKVGELEYQLDSEELPKNPFGRTGLKGRGCLPRWGPNKYIYIIITRWKDKDPSSEHIEVVLESTGEGLCLPGGYIHTENQYEIIQSHFDSEGIWREDKDMILFFTSLSEGGKKGETKRSFLNILEKKKKEIKDFTAERVKKGYMDEETNTDQAWCEAEVWHFHYNRQCNVENAFKGTMQWHMISEEMLMQVPIGQAAIMYTIAKDKKAIMEVL